MLGRVARVLGRVPRILCTKEVAYTYAVLLNLSIFEYFDYLSIFEYFDYLSIFEYFEYFSKILKFVDQSGI